MSFCLDFYKSGQSDKKDDVSMKKCGDLGYKSKSGQTCGYRIADHAESCPHHAPGGSRAKEFQLRGAMASKYDRLPSKIQSAKLSTTEEIRQVYADVIETVTTMKRIDRNRLEVVVKCLNGGGALLQTQMIRELNDALLRAQGHGPALVILEGLKRRKTRRLPGLPERGAPIEEAATASPTREETCRGG